MKYIKNIDEFINESLITESSLSRIWQHIEGNTSFGVISPFRGELSRKENEKRYVQLKNYIREKGLGYIEMKGGFEEEGGWVTEKSLFIPNIRKDDIIELGIKYDQYSVIFKDHSEFVEIGTNDEAGVGVTKNSFEIDGKNIIQDKSLTDLFYSSLVKGSHRGRKFLFKMGQPAPEDSGDVQVRESFLYEVQPLSFNEVAYGNKKPGRDNKLVPIFK